MSVRTQKTITNVCFGAGIGAVLLLGRFDSLQWLLVLIASVAGTVALGLHLYSQWRLPKQLPLAPATTASVLEQLAQDSSVAEVDEKEEATAVVLFSREVHATALDPLYARTFFFRYAYQQARFTTDHIVDIAKRLTPSRTDFEVTLKPDGSVTIRPVVVPHFGEVAFERQEFELRL